MASKASALFEPIKNTRLVLFIRRSLSLQVAVGMTLVMLTVLSLLFLAVTYQVRLNIYDQRREQILDDATVRLVQAQTTFDQSTAATTDQVQDLAHQLVSSLRSSATGAGAVGTMLLRSAGTSSAFAINDLVDGDLIEVVSPEMREMTAKGQGPYYQAITIEGDGRGKYPGIVVGDIVTLPLAGEYELYTVYSLRDDQDTVTMLSRTLILGSIPLILLFAVGVVYTVYRLLRPVRTTAQAVTKLADGDLSVRVQADGIDEMAQLASAFNDMAASLTRKIAEYDELSKLEQRFVSDVSHELRTPLTTIRMAEEMLYDSREDFDPISARSAELLHQQVDRFEKMLADLLEISRYDSKSASLELDDVNFNELSQKVIDANQALADNLGVEVTFIAKEPRNVAEADSRRMERVLRNFLVNAIEHAEGGPVEVEVGSDDDVTSIRVRDYGVGMDEVTRQHVFERFYRADPARTRTTGGTGLGLSIAREDVSLHGGKIEAYGELGRGSAFMVTLPRRQGVVFEGGALELWEEK
ncbi:MAG: MtrAB system histidine kinase MtrB [Actinomycetaceae bacterium]|nr:MtrAB system histidine kinase MtrB [Actinomycetaceae bacterium]